MQRPSLAERLARTGPLLLDGPTGTELARRGVSTDSPLWSAAALIEAPEVVAQIHRDYVAVGAELITANTFRTHTRTLEKLGDNGDARELTRVAVDLAREAAEGRAWIAGSMAPLEDCYRPDLTPPEEDLDREHRQMAENLAAAEVDLVLAETHPTIRESAAAVRAANWVGLPVIVSWVCGRDGRLLSGETIAEAVATVLPLKPLAVSVNCLPAEAAATAVRELMKAAGGVSVGVYANIGWMESDGCWVAGLGAEPAAYAQLAAQWREWGAGLIGGCCGTTPAHIAALRQRLVGEGTPHRAG